MGHYNTVVYIVGPPVTDKTFLLPLIVYFEMSYSIFLCLYLLVQKARITIKCDPAS